ncbi:MULTISPECIES: WbqC family protein [Bradyrhizobium]|uniref:WbqC family protein n=1 Tax=Bradyrhizobium brasilense TaxID=1419277 RepID=A0ABY8JMM1_9BRAD|nr:MULTISPECIES: WbqC family protein [Bradyrhizobium]WFU66920.1 WbqC family protein [Bradyrhizobium brasilense]
MTGLVAIHQPNFFPWLGYFEKIRRADALVFLDVVAYPRAGSGGMGSWCNRVRLAVQGEARWVTCPLQHMPLGTPIGTVSIDDAQPWRAKLLRTLEVNYGKAPRFEDGMMLLRPLILESEGNLAAFNIRAIKAIAVHLGLSTRFVLQSTLQYSGKATDLLVSLVRAVDGSAYLSGDGAAGYQRDELFAENGLGLVKLNFVQRAYCDPSRFIPGLSVIDYLMWDGRPLAEAVQGP